MKKDQTKSHFQEMKGEVKGVAVNFVAIREPEYDGNMLNAHGKMEAAYAELKRESNKTGSGT